MRWLNLMYQKRLHYQMVELLLLVIQEFLGASYRTIYLCEEIMLQEVVGIDKKVVLFLNLLRK